VNTWQNNFSENVIYILFSTNFQFYWTKHSCNLTKDKALHTITKLDTYRKFHVHGFWGLQAYHKLISSLLLTYKVRYKSSNKMLVGSKLNDLGAADKLVCKNKITLKYTTIIYKISRFIKSFPKLRININHGGSSDAEL